MHWFIEVVGTGKRRPVAMIGTDYGQTNLAHHDAEMALSDEKRTDERATSRWSSNVNIAGVSIGS